MNGRRYAWSEVRHQSLRSYVLQRARRYNSKLCGRSDRKMLIVVEVLPSMKIARDTRNRKREEPIPATQLLDQTISISDQEPLSNPSAQKRRSSLRIDPWNQRNASKCHLLPSAYQSKTSYCDRVHDGVSTTAASVLDIGEPGASGRTPAGSYGRAAGAR